MTERACKVGREDEEDEFAREKAPGFMALEEDVGSWIPGGRKSAKPFWKEVFEDVCKD